MKRCIVILNYISWVALLCGAVGKMMFPLWASWVFLVSAVLLAVTQFILRARGGGFVLRRLVFQQQVASLALVVAGVLMFTHTRNEWIVAMFIGAILELYTVYRIGQEVEKEGK